MVNVQGIDNNNSAVRFNAVLDRVFTSESSTEPVTVAEVKTFCKISTGTAEDTLLASLISTARIQCEDFTGISFIPRTVTAVVNNTNGGIYFPYCPLVSITSIKDEDGNAITSPDYKVSGTMFPQLITPKYNRLELKFTAGYGTTQWPIPASLKSAVLQQVFYLYNNRGETSQASRNGTVVELTLSPQAKATLSRVRRVG